MTAGVMLPLSPSQADQPVYAALKLRIYQHVLEQVRVNGRWPEATQLEASIAHPFFRGLTARRVRRLIEPPQDPQAGYTELYGATSHLFYQRLLSLNHGLVLRAADRTFRRNKVFEWGEPIFTRNLCTMAAIEHHLQGRYDFGIDLIRLYETFGDRPFTKSAFEELLRHNIRVVLSRHAPGERKAATLSQSSGFQTFVENRFGALVRARLVEPLRALGEERFRLTAQGFEAGLYLDLFLHNIWFTGAVPQCPHCTGKPLAKNGAAPILHVPPPRLG